MWRGSHTHFYAGLVAGGTVSGLVLGSIGSVLSPIPHGIRLVAYGALLLAVVVRLGLAGPDGLPQRRRLVPQEVASLDTGPFLFGFEMGTGFRTFSPNPAPLLLALLLVSNGNPVAGAVAGASFAMGRVAAALMRLAFDDGERLDRGYASYSAWLVALGMTGIGICAATGFA